MNAAKLLVEASPSAVPWIEGAQRPEVNPVCHSYVVKLVTDVHEFRDALRLRYRVFNLELGEGLSSSHAARQDFDEFDPVFKHVIVKQSDTQEIVGTYRLQTGTMALNNLGYYSEREFDFAPYEPIRGQILELGRACIDERHRNSRVLLLLWKAIVQFALQQGCQYLIGCSSLNSRNLVAGAAVFAQMQNVLAPQELRTVPQPPYAFDWQGTNPDDDEARIPKLLRAYLNVGARICAPPAQDIAFGTIDFLTLLDLGRLSRGGRARLLGE